MQGACSSGISSSDSVSAEVALLGYTIVLLLLCGSIDGLNGNVNRIKV